MGSRNSSRKRFEAWSREKANEIHASETPSTEGAQPQRRFDRKALQLCRQVSRTLNYTLSECGDRVLSDLYVESVEPAPDATRLLITVMTSDPSRGPADILAHLYQASGRLRAEIATDIHRKKVPELTFRCVVPQKEAPSVPPEAETTSD